GGGLAGGGDFDGLRIGFDDVYRNALEIRGVADTRLYPEGLELGGDVLFRQSANPCSGGAALEEVGRKEPEVRIYLLRGNTGSGGSSRRSTLCIGFQRQPRKQRKGDQTSETIHRFTQCV